MNNIETHPFTPFLPIGAKILMLGTFPPKKDRWSMDFYYPNWINDMWRIMGIIFYDDKDYFCINEKKTFKLEALKIFLEEKHLALHDTGHKVVRLKDNAADKFLYIEEQINLEKFIKDSPSIIAIVSTGEKAAQVIAEKTQTEIPKCGDSVDIVCNGRNLKHFRMPSSSRAYPLSLIKKADIYKNMFLKLGYKI